MFESLLDEWANVVTKDIESDIHPFLISMNCVDFGTGMRQIAQVACQLIEVIRYSNQCSVVDQFFFVF
jgi:hypothetical protein